MPVVELHLNAGRIVLNNRTDLYLMTGQGRHAREALHCRDGVYGFLEQFGSRG